MGQTFGTMAAEPYSRYLLSKRSVDDRALNRPVLERLGGELRVLGDKVPRIVEIGAGMGTMVARLVEWRLLRRAEYLLLDVDRGVLADARSWLPAWGEAHGLRSEGMGDGLRLYDRQGVDLVLRFVCAELGQFLEEPTHATADLLIANAVLDLVDVPVMLPRLFQLLVPGGLFWFSLNFDGETLFQPELPDDLPLMRVYHRSMDERVRYGAPAGDSRTGRHLFGHLRAAGATLLAAGASDWVVHPEGGRYPAEEGLFLRQILQTIGAELHKHADVDAAALARWLRTRGEQVDRGELVYIAHQLDFLGRRS